MLFAGFKPLVQGLDADPGQPAVRSRSIQTLQGEGGALQLLLSNLADLTNALADKDQVIGEVIDNLTSVLTAVGERDSELSNLIIQLRTFVSGLAAGPHDDRQRHRRHQQPGHLDRGPADPDPGAADQGRHAT